MSLGSWKIRFNFHYFAALLLLALVTAALYFRDENERIMEEQRLHRQQLNPICDCKEEEERVPSSTKNESVSKNFEERITRNDSNRNCDFFSGRWVFDNVSYPLYQEGHCSFMLPDFACEKYGRKDFKYQNWRWQPQDCDLPRFNATVFLEKLRGKKLIYVGDSLNKNQWISMLCLIESALPPSSPKSVPRAENLFMFHAAEYNATIGFYWSPLLVESNCDDPDTHRVENRIFRINSIEKHATHWTDADILIFDAFMWWLDPTMTILYGSFGSPNSTYKKIEMKTRRLEMTLETWSNWLEININRTKTRLFFMSLSPYHYRGESWDVEQNCYNETEPIFKEEYWGIATDREIMDVVESSIRKLENRGLKIEYLNITNLSDYRKDAHPSIYRKFFHPPPEEKLKDPRSYSDCVHWCLPGVPDVWNHILYAYVINSQTYAFTSP